MESKIICKYCQKTFVSISNLNTHQKTAKYCLKLQNKPVSNDFKCDDCGKKFTTLYKVNHHLKSCNANNITFQLKKEGDMLKNKNIELKKYKIKYYDLLENTKSMKKEYKRKIQILQDKLENVAIQVALCPQTQINNVNTIIQNTDSSTDDNF